MDKAKSSPTQKWKARQAGIRQRWSKLSEDELERTEGREDQIVRLLEKKYGYSGKEAKKEYEDFVAEEEERRKLPSDLIKDLDSVHE